MRIVPFPPDEESRVQQLRTYQILDTAPEKDFDDLVELIAILCNCSVAAITFIDSDRQWIKAATGIDTIETSREDAFCSYTILQDEVMLVQDATKDERFRDNPFVQGEDGIRFYAGAPIVASSGHNLGAVCVVDTRPRALSEPERRALKAISAQVSRLLELRLKNRLLEEQAGRTRLLQQELLLQQLQQQETANLQVSTELHENLAQGLAATKMFLELAEERPDPALITRCREQLSQLILQARLLSQRLYPSTLRESGLGHLLHQLARSAEQLHGLKLTLNLKEDEQLSGELSILLYRIAEEQVANIVSHALAGRVTISLQASEKVVLTISDDGRGFDPQTFRQGHGLLKAASLIDYYGGEIDISSSPNAGCCLTVILPRISQHHTSSQGMTLNQAV
jgi:signal transduction histidine kinase